MAVLVCRTKEGVAGFACEDVAVILPDLNGNGSVVYTGVHPGGISVIDAPADLVERWIDLRSDYDDSEEDEWEAGEDGAADEGVHTLS